MTFVQIDTITGNGGTVNRNIPLTGTVGASSAIRFTVTGVNNTNEVISVDDVAVTFTLPPTTADQTPSTAARVMIRSSGTPIRPAPTDGRDVVDGGTEGAPGDTFVDQRQAGAETYNIYTRAAWQAARQLARRLQRRHRDRCCPQRPDQRRCDRGTPRDRGDPHQQRRPVRDDGTAGGDTFNIVGDFSGTSLRLNTITIDGDAGDDTIDISSLYSAHRIVFKSNGGHDTIIGTLRSQDVIELPDGATPDDYEVTENGRHDAREPRPTRSPSQAKCSEPEVRPREDEDETRMIMTTMMTTKTRMITSRATITTTTTTDDDHATQSCADRRRGRPGAAGDGEGETSLPSAARQRCLHKAATTSARTACNARRKAGATWSSAGRATTTSLAAKVRTCSTATAATTASSATAATTSSMPERATITLYGGAGNDIFVASQGDGNDTYYGDDMAGGCGSGGSDTLDMAAISANITVDLGTGSRAAAVPRAASRARTCCGVWRTS